MVPAVTMTTSPGPSAIRHPGPCSGHRFRCYRPACRAVFGDYKTVELAGNRIVYYCHRTEAPADVVDLRMLEVAS
jgi:hypothetical protein